MTDNTDKNTPKSIQKHMPEQKISKCIDIQKNCIKCIKTAWKAKNDNAKQKAKTATMPENKGVAGFDVFKKALKYIV